MVKAKFMAECGKHLEKDRDPKHPNAITLDLGCDEDYLYHSTITMHDNFPGHYIDIMNKIGEISGVMTSFATKCAEVDNLIKFTNDPSKHRVRLSLSPEEHRKTLEKNTSPIVDRLSAINKLVDAGFEVHINLSPVVVTDNFVQEYNDLLKLINESLSDKAKQQMAYEIIFLTHSKSEFIPIQNLNKKAHDMMVNGPLSLEPKWNKPNVLSYSRKDKNDLKTIMSNLININTPYSRIRYMF